jgi:hypothetical protein
VPIHKLRSEALRSAGIGATGSLTPPISITGTKRTPSNFTSPASVPSHK